MPFKGHRQCTYRVNRPRKRKPPVNPLASEANIDPTCASAKKLKNNEAFSVSSNDSHFYVLMAFNKVFGELSTLVKCKKCNSDVSFEKSQNFGLGFVLHVICDCADNKINSCPKIENRAFEVNRRMVLAMRLIGVGNEGLNMFTSIMDIGEGLSHQGYYNVLDHIKIATKAVYDKVIHLAAVEESQKNVEDGKPNNELIISGDGSWARRG